MVSVLNAGRAACRIRVEPPTGPHFRVVRVDWPQVRTHNANNAGKAESCLAISQTVDLDGLSRATPEALSFAGGLRKAGAQRDDAAPVFTSLVAPGVVITVHVCFVPAPGHGGTAGGINSESTWSSKRIKRDANSASCRDAIRIKSSCGTDTEIPLSYI